MEADRALAMRDDELQAILREFHRRDPQRFERLTSQAKVVTGPEASQAAPSPAPAAPPHSRESRPLELIPT
jgi:hypothetical protein